ncbi:family 10 glycosylhydrolase [Capilliphycus salinus ALCB114379]|uniref:family 10 glycosylhydrolase n=1 Tax=Capilliphycus salinus TaxID=2768948 RepID=UPI0039A5DEC1
MIQKHSLSFLTQALVGTLAGTFIGCGVLLPSSTAIAGAVLGVVRSDSATDWSQIESRLKASRVNYTTVDLENIRSLTDLAGIQVLFLPNVEVLRTEQVKIIQQWVNQGGKLIASGPIGQKSTPLARQLLRTLLGSYWAFPLSTPAQPEAKSHRCQEQICRELTQWSPTVESQGTVNGGVLIPSSLESYTAGVWSGSGGSPSVITTRSATYIGWRWGSSEGADVDALWLQAAVNRYEGSVNPGLALNSPTSPPVQQPVQNPPENPEPNNTSTLPPVQQPVQNPPENPEPNNTSTSPPVQQPTVNSNRRNTSRANTAANRNSNSNPTSAAGHTSRANTAANRNSNSNPTSAAGHTSRANTAANRNSNSNPTSAAPPTQPRSRNQANRRERTDRQNSRSQADNNNNNNNQPSARTQPVQPTPAASAGQNSSVLSRLSPGSTSGANNRSVPENFVDPSDQVAPAGLSVTPGNEPIDEYMAMGMRQELMNLLGRFENALAAANSSSTPVSLKVASTQLNEVAQSNTIDNQSATAVIAFVEQVLKDFPELVNQQNWAVARQQWLEARQKLWENYPIDGQRAGAEIRAVWLDRGTIVQARSEAGLAKIFDQLAQAGINTVFFETVNAGFPIYPTKVAPQQNPSTRGWDPLASAVKLAHDRGMELHAWLWTFATANQRHNPLIGQPSTYIGPVLTAHPDWVNRDNRGRMWHENDGKAYLDPANREVRSYILRLVGEIVYNYDVDGIQLDYIRYPFQDPNRNFNFGYGTAGREQFRQLTGVDPISISPKDTQLWQQWTNFRVEQVNSMVREVSQFLRQQYPDVIFSVAVFPHPEADRIRKIQQHWETWTQQNYVDLLVPMTYSLDTNRLQRITQPLTDSNRLGATLIVPSVKLLDIPEIVAIDQIQALRDLPTGGYSIFAVETIGYHLQGFFNRTQGCGRQGCPSTAIPYREPFVAAADRYTALKREWSFLLANDRLWIRDNELEALSRKAEELGEALNELAANPTAQNFNNAQRLLSAFQAQFQRSMRLQALERRYQVESWENRLASVEMLLRYGERVELNPSTATRQ